jgi:hypothetical protein
VTILEHLSLLAAQCGAQDAEIRSAKMSHEPAPSY